MPSKISRLKLKKKNKSKIVCLTAYSKNVAEEVDKYTDLILVGDSLGSVLYNFDTTRKVNLTMMIEHSKSVRKGVKKSLMIVDMPFNTYKNKFQALKNCKKVIKETKCDGVKLEGGRKMKSIIEYLVSNKIPVMGHIGITPQSVRGKFRYKGKTAKEKNNLLNDSKILEEAGAFSIVLECIEKKLSKKITKSIGIPTIGIGSSKFCDGQILVLDDLLGLTDSKIKFVKRYANLKSNIRNAVKRFGSDVKKGSYPSIKYSY
jgi:3-methyl-2-oxobutanoate hydroxymethyltransferase